MKTLLIAMAMLAATICPTKAEDHVFSTNLTVGSKGVEVVMLQTYLEAKGFLVMPKGAAKGYFGSLTRAALAAYQVSKGIAPPVGYAGPITRAAIMADGAVKTEVKK